MGNETKVLLKAGVFGLAWPCLYLPLSTRIGDWSAAAVAAIIATLLFHWLPPRIHAGLTVVKSVALSLAAGVTAGGAVFLVDTLL